MSKPLTNDPVIVDLTDTSDDTPWGLFDVSGSSSTALSFVKNPQLLPVHIINPNATSSRSKDTFAIIFVVFLALVLGVIPVFNSYVFFQYDKFITGASSSVYFGLSLQKRWQLGLAWGGITVFIVTLPLLITLFFRRARFRTILFFLALLQGDILFFAWGVNIASLSLIAMCTALSCSTVSWIGLTPMVLVASLTIVRISFNSLISTIPSRNLFQSNAKHPALITLLILYILFSNLIPTLIVERATQKFVFKDEEAFFIFPRAAFRDAKNFHLATDNNIGWCSNIEHPKNITDKNDLKQYYANAKCPEKERQLGCDMGSNTTMTRKWLAWVLDTRATWVACFTYQRNCERKLYYPLYCDRVVEECSRLCQFREGYFLGNKYGRSDTMLLKNIKKLVHDEDCGSVKWNLSPAFTDGKNVEVESEVLLKTQCEYEKEEYGLKFTFCDDSDGEPPPLLDNIEPFCRDFRRRSNYTQIPPIRYQTIPAVT